jgi:lipopolysaccharide transport system ATP-binding protein
MSSDPRDLAIRARGVGKRFDIGRALTRHDTLRDTIAASARRVLDRVRTLRSGEATEPFWALREVSFELPHGQALGVIGPNGAGKSTLLKILSRITEPTTGEVVLRGRVGALLEVGTGFHTELTGRENIFLNGAILGMTRAEIARKFDEIVAFAGVERFIDTPVKHHSSGMYLRLGFAVAAHLEPEILIVDEVLAVGDAAFQKKCMGKMGEMSRGGRTVVFVSHNMTAMLGLCDRVVWLDQGRIQADGRPADVVGRYLASTRSRATHREWPSMDDAPGGPHVRLRGAWVRAEDGEDPTAIDVRTPFRLEFEYWNLKPGARLALSVGVYDDKGTLAFLTGPTEEPRPRPEGLIRDTCRVPGDLMNDGLYTLELMIVEDHTRLLFKHEDLLTWEIADSADLRAGWFGEWQGALRPMLDWDTEDVGPLEASGSPRAAS